MRFSVAALTTLSRAPAPPIGDARETRRPCDCAGTQLLQSARRRAADLAIFGEFTNAGKKRIDAVDTVDGNVIPLDKDAPRETGIKLPFKGQAMQGFSGLKSLGNGMFLVLPDNDLAVKPIPPTPCWSCTRSSPTGLAARSKSSRRFSCTTRTRKSVPDRASRAAQALSHRRRSRRRKLPGPSAIRSGWRWIPARI